MEAVVRVSDVLTVVMIALFVTYFVGFYRLHAKLTKEDLLRYRRGGRPWLNLLVLGAFLALLYAPRVELRLAAPPLLLGYVLLASRAHHRRLAESGFQPEFLSRWRRNSLVGGAAMALLFVELFLSAQGY